MPRLPRFGEYNIAFHFVNDDGVPYAYTRYKAVNRRTNEVIEGLTNHNGWSSRLYSDYPDEFEIHLQLDWQN